MKSIDPESTESDVQIVASLSAEWADSCEELLYFNPQQELFRDQILTSIHSYGMPGIKIDDETIHIKLGESVIPNAFFALATVDDDTVLAGLILFTREKSALLCIHLSVADEFTSRGSYAHYRIAHRLLDEVRRVAVRIAGVDEMFIYYNRHSYSIPLTRSLIE